MNHVHQNLPKPQRHVFNFVLFGPKNLNMFDILSQETKKKKPLHISNAGTRECLQSCCRLISISALTKLNYTVCGRRPLLQLGVSQHIKFWARVTGPPTAANAPMMLRLKQRWGEIDSEMLRKMEGRQAGRGSDIWEEFCPKLAVSNSHFLFNCFFRKWTIHRPSLQCGSVSVQSYAVTTPPPSSNRHTLSDYPHPLLPHECSQSHYHNAMHQ